jgi:mannose-1-phosphate guanylyltransferase
MRDIVICVSYLGKTIEDYFGDGRKFNVSIEYAVSEKPLGTAGQLKSAEEFLDDTFVCVYGDSVYQFDLHKMISKHRQRKALVTMALMKYNTKLRYGFIDVDNNERVKAWKEKPEFKGLINIGCYVMEPEFLSYMPKDSAVGMDSIFMRVLKSKKKVYSYVISGGFIDIGNKRSYLAAYKEYLSKLGRI